MLPGAHTGFELDPRLEAASCPAMWLGLCEFRVMDDRRWPWLVLVPQRPGIAETHDLTPLDQAMLTFETNMVAASLKRLTSCERINLGAIGNVERQLHIHVVARSPGDPGWPGVVWGMEPRELWPRAALRSFVEQVRSAL